VREVFVATGAFGDIREAESSGQPAPAAKADRLYRLFNNSNRLLRLVCGFGIAAVPP
jgi:hypothetical protein